MRCVSGDTLGQRNHRRRTRSRRISRADGSRALPSESRSASASGRGDSGSGGSVRGAVVSAVAVSVADAIEGFDLREFAVDVLELLAQALDVAVDRAVIDVDVLAIGRIHQLVAVFDVPGTLRQ